MNDLIIKRRWIRDICWTICLTIGMVWAIICQPDGKWSFAYGPLLIMCILGGYNIIKDRHQTVTFDTNGVTTPDGEFCDWCNIRRIEYRKSWPSLKLHIYTKKSSFVIETLQYSFKFKMLKEYMLINHPDIPCDSYVIELPGNGGWETKNKRQFKFDSTEEHHLSGKKHQNADSKSHKQ
ncbi:MAG: hypothetical protein MJ010_09020 [Paludibacteraceae bacterium]|nr:hypothetical protein [Paludibacteraceae bacterium]